MYNSIPADAAPNEAAGPPSAAKVLQNLRYDYDPVGNVLTVSNGTEETCFWSIQKAVQEKTYA